MIDHVSYSFRQAQKTYTWSKIDFKCRTLFSTLRKHTYQVRLPQVSRSIRHAQKTYMPSKIDMCEDDQSQSSHSCSLGCVWLSKSRTLFGTLRKRTCQDVTGDCLQVSCFRGCLFSLQLCDYIVVVIGIKHSVNLPFILTIFTTWHS